MSDPLRASLPSYAFFASLLGMAGLPIYIHAPKFFVDTYGVTLATLGFALFALRLIDFVQDPLFGRLAARSAHLRAWPAWIGGGVMSLGMIGLFHVSAPISPVLWFCLTLTLVFSGFSFLSIKFYAQGVVAFGEAGQLHLARWRETGNLLGVCIAAIAPTLLLTLSDRPFSMFSIGFAILMFFALLAMHAQWQHKGDVEADNSSGFQALFKDHMVRQMLFLAVLNTAPVAVSSTLFLFFVESRLGQPDAAGPLLILFFLAAACSAPIWTALAHRFKIKLVLLSAMSLAIASFAYAFFLGQGDVAVFALICFASGMTLGADLALLPAIFAKRLAQSGNSAELGFGFWNFASKLSLALAAVLVLPLVEFYGFRVGQDNSEAGLWALSFGYAAIPCFLKVVAILMVLKIEFEDAEHARL